MNESVKALAIVALPIALFAGYLFGVGSAQIYAGERPDEIYWAYGFNFLQTVMSGIGIYFVVKNLIEVRRSNEIQENINRGWVTVSIQITSSVFDETLRDDKFVPCLTVNFDTFLRNVGDKPVNGVQFEAMHSAAEGPDYEEMHKLEWAHRHMKIRGETETTILPGESLHIDRYAADFLVSDKASGGGGCYVGLVRYRTGGYHSEPRETPFSFKIWDTRMGPGRPTIVKSTPGGAT